MHCIRWALEWTQLGIHDLRFGVRRRVNTTAVLSPESGCVTLELDCAGRRTRAELLAVGQLADRGVPAWEQEFSPVRTPRTPTEA
jgi:hypothetical protein